MLGKRVCWWHRRSFVWTRLVVIVIQTLGSKLTAAIKVRVKVIK